MRWVMWYMCMCACIYAYACACVHVCVCVCVSVEVAVLGVRVGATCIHSALHPYVLYVGCLTQQSYVLDGIRSLDFPS